MYRRKKPTVNCSIANGSPINWGVTYRNGYYYFGTSTSTASTVSTSPVLSSVPVIPYFDFGTEYAQKDILLRDYFYNALLVEDALLNGTAEQLRNGSLSEDDIEIPAVLDLTAIAAAGNSLQEGTINIMQQLADGTLSYEEYMDMITPDEVVEPDPTVDPSESTEPSEEPDVPEEIDPYTFDLRRIFPFCIPFDLYDFLTCLNASPVAPVIHWEIQLPGGGSYPLDLDLSPFDSVAQLLRRLQLLAFCIALGIKTRDLIKG